MGFFKIFAGRPLVFCVFTATISLLLSFFLSLYGKITLFLVYVGFAIFLSKSKSKQGAFGAVSPRIYAVLCVMSAVLIASSVINFDIKQITVDKYTQNPVTVTAYPVPTYDNYVKVTNINGKECSYYGFISGDELPKNYEIFTCTALITPVGGDIYVIGKNAAFSAEISEVVTLGKRASSIFEKGNRINLFCRNAVYKYCRSNPGLVSGIFLGNRDDIPPTVNSDFARSGVSHIIAVSGMHIIISLAVLAYLCNIFINSKVTRCVVLLGAATFYTVLTGCGFSVLRAALMYMFINLAGILRAENDSLTSLFSSLYIICLFQPYAVFDVSLQLSFAATFGIVVFGVPLSKKLSPYFEKIKNKQLKKLTEYTVLSLVMSLCAVLLTVPFTAVYFGSMSVISPIVTLLLSPFVNIILYAAPFLALFCKLEPLGRLFGQICDTSASICVDIARFFSENTAFAISFELPFTLIIFALTAAVLLLLMIIGITKKRLYALVCALAVIVYSISMSVYFIGNHQRDEVIYTHDGGEVVCAVNGNYAHAVDISQSYGKAHSEMISALRKRGILQLDILVLTHCGSGQAKLLERLDSDIGIKYVIFPKDDKYTQHVEITAQLLGIKYEKYNADKEFTYENIVITPSHYVMQDRGCIVEINGAVYFSGCDKSPLNEERAKRNKLVIYGKYSLLDKTKFTPIKNTNNVIITPYVKNELFHQKEYASYIEGKNIITSETSCEVDMTKLKQ